MKESMLGPILHVVVVGFHHKKGCQVEFSFPPLIPGSEPDSNTCPPGWKYLPTLALPDGSHNFEADTVYFHLPSLTNPKQTVYGISCFRQIPVEGWFAKYIDKGNAKHSRLTGVSLRFTSQVESLATGEC
uniref:UDENN domain-containing protein n=1 Tax=Timema monikensis TaxID=170555 RepID=A0A7R9E3F4_9NEOP|nr:unnamed protein product [Timema monikensis]